MTFLVEAFNRQAQVHAAIREEESWKGKEEVFHGMIITYSHAILATITLSKSSYV